MEAIEDKQILFPQRKVDSVPEQVAHRGVIVCVGANGSGKSRLGEWFDNKYPDKQLQKRVYRISAQKSLRFPKELTTSSMDEATEAVLYGRALNIYEKQTEEQLLQARQRRFQQNKPVPLDDYTELVRLLYT